MMNQTRTLPGKAIELPEVKITDTGVREKTQGTFTPPFEVIQHLVSDKPHRVQKRRRLGEEPKAEQGPI